jgi:hypothetical protein
MYGASQVLNLKSKLIAFGALLLTVLGFFVRLKVVTNQRDKAQDSARKYKAWSERQEDTRQIDAEIEQEYSHRAEEAREALENDEIPDHLRNPRR